VGEAAQRLRGAEQTQRDAIRAAFEAGASLRQIATKALLSHEQVRRIVRNHKQESPTAYRVTVERRGLCPARDATGRPRSVEARRRRPRELDRRKQARRHVEATKVRPAPTHAALEYDDDDL
jgi:hypothetical protein